MDSIFRIAAVGAFALSAACTMEIPSLAADAGVDATEVDASEATQLVVEFGSEPEIPFTEDGLYAPRVDGVHIDLDDVRAIGDPGATEGAKLSLDWNDVLIPGPYVARGAAPGLYSQLRATVLRTEMYGSVLVAGRRVSFEILDEAPPSLTLEMPLADCLVEAGHQKQTPVLFRAEEIVEAIVWDDVPADADGVLRIDARSPALIAAVREHLEESFEYDAED